jgi:hypothetical protein
VVPGVTITLPSGSTPSDTPLPPEAALPPATPPTTYVRPPAVTALDLELQREMARLHVNDRTDCQASLQSTTRAIEAKILELQRQEPPWEAGDLVEVGSCTSRLARLFGSDALHDFGLSLRAVARQVENREARGCLALKRAYLHRACECTRKGMTITTDEAIQDQSLETFSAVRNLEQRAQNQGIMNPRIRQIVQRASAVHDCYNLQTLETLRSTEQALDRELDLSPGRGAPPSGPQPSQPLSPPQ